MDFGDALRALKQGARVARAGWNGKGIWIALTPGSAFAATHAKCGHAAAHRAVELKDTDGQIELLPHIDMRAADGSMVIGWLASQTDMLADDWHVLGDPASIEHNVDAKLVNGAVRIEVQISNLQRIASGGWAAGYLPAIRVDDPEEFAAELCNALNAEEEDGTTAVHRLFDSAIENAFENGAGVELTDEQAEDLAALFRKPGGA